MKLNVCVCMCVFVCVCVCVSVCVSSHNHFFVPHPLFLEGISSLLFGKWPPLCGLWQMVYQTRLRSRSSLQMALTRFKGESGRSTWQCVCVCLCVCVCACKCVCGE